MIIKYSERSAKTNIVPVVISRYAQEKKLRHAKTGDFLKRKAPVIEIAMAIVKKKIIHDCETASPLSVKHEKRLINKVLFGVLLCP